MKRTQGSEAETTTVPMLDPEIVTRSWLLQRLGWRPSKAPSEVGIARNSVRRYLRQGATAQKLELRVGGALRRGAAGSQIPAPREDAQPAGPDRSWSIV